VIVANNASKFPKICKCYTLKKNYISCLIYRIWYQIKQKRYCRRFSKAKYLIRFPSKFCRCKKSFTINVGSESVCFKNSNFIYIYYFHDLIDELNFSGMNKHKTFNWVTYFHRIYQQALTSSVKAY
jgi:hypothetical protein